MADVVVTRHRQKLLCFLNSIAYLLVKDLALHKRPSDWIRVGKCVSALLRRARHQQPQTF